LSLGQPVSFLPHVFQLSLSKAKDPGPTEVCVMAFKKEIKTSVGTNHQKK
jgi:hypothetical protein